MTIENKDNEKTGVDFLDNDVKFTRVEIVCGNHFEPLCHVGCTWCQNYGYICEGIISRGNCPWGTFKTEKEKQKIKEVRCLLQKYNNLEVLKLYEYEIELNDFKDIEEGEYLETLKKELEVAKSTTIEEMQQYLKENLPNFEDEEIESYFNSISNEEENEYICNNDNSDKNKDDISF